MILRSALLATLLLLSFPPAHAEPAPTARAEIEYLLSHVETSGCSFQRNGTWYDGTRAKAHLRTKYEYLAARNLITTAEDFIDKGATASSFSGKPYKIKCGTNPEVECGPWLHDLLNRFRARSEADAA